MKSRLAGRLSKLVSACFVKTRAPMITSSSTRSWIQVNGRSSGVGDSVRFTQELTDPSSGYGYIYRKTVRLVEGKPEMVLEHSLRNTGRRTIQSAVYNHIAGRDPRLPEGCNVPSRAKPYEPGSLGSGAAGQLAVSKQTRHVSLRTQSGGTGQRSGRTAREGMAPS